MHQSRGMRIYKGGWFRNGDFRGLCRKDLAKLVWMARGGQWGLWWGLTGLVTLERRSNWYKPRLCNASRIFFKEEQNHLVKKCSLYLKHPDDLYITLKSWPKHALPLTLDKQRTRGNRMKLSVALTQQDLSLWNRVETSNLMKIPA